MIKKIVILVLISGTCLQAASAGISIPRFGIPATINTPVCQISKAWAQSCVQNLSNADILLLANILYENHKMISLMATLRQVSDSTTQRFIETKDALAQMGGSAIANSLVDQCTRQLSFMKKLAREKVLVATSRAHCTKKINEERKANPALDQAVSEFETICQSALRVHLDNCAFNLVNNYHVTNLNNIARDFKALTNEIKSFHEISGGQKVFACGTELANSLEIIGHEILSHAANISQRSCEMEKTTAALFAQLYTDLFNTLPQEQRDSLQHMFNSKGLIHPNQRYYLMLPFPDHLHREISEL